MTRAATRQPAGSKAQTRTRRRDALKWRGSIPFGPKTESFPSSSYTPSTFLPPLRQTVASWRPSISAGNACGWPQIPADEHPPASVRSKTLHQHRYHCAAEQPAPMSAATTALHVERRHQQPSKNSDAMRQPHMHPIKKAIPAVSFSDPTISSTRTKALLHPKSASAPP